MKINKLFFMALGLSGIILSSISYAQDSGVGSSGTGGSVGSSTGSGASSTSLGSEIPPTDSSYGLPTSEVTVDPANVKSTQPYPPITDPNVNPGVANSLTNSTTDPNLISEPRKSEQNQERARKEREEREKRLQEINRDSLQRDSQ